MREIAGERRRFDCRRIGPMLEREGITMNHKKLRWLYKEEGLAVKRRRGRDLTPLTGSSCWVIPTALTIDRYVPNHAGHPQSRIDELMPWAFKHRQINAA